MVRRVGDDWFHSPGGRDRYPEAAAEAPPQLPDGPPVVIYVPVLCPYCCSRDCPVTASPKPGAPGLRYHRCDGCGQTFKSLERLPAKPHV